MNFSLWMKHAFHTLHINMFWWRVQSEWAAPSVYRPYTLLKGTLTVSRKLCWHFSRYHPISSFWLDLKKQPFVFWAKSHWTEPLPPQQHKTDLLTNQKSKRFLITLSLKTKKCRMKRYAICEICIFVSLPFSVIVTLFSCVCVCDPEWMVEILAFIEEVPSRSKHQSKDIRNAVF